MSDLKKAALDLEEQADFGGLFQSQAKNASYVRPSFEIGSVCNFLLRDILWNYRYAFPILKKKC
jgi:hypothetical protein